MNSQIKKLEPEPIDYRERRGAISTYGRALKSSSQLWWTLVSIAVVGATALVIVFASASGSKSTPFVIGLLVALLSILLGVALIWKYTKQNFIAPDLAFRKWLLQVCDGELDVRIDLPPSHPHFKELNFHTRNLAASLNQLTTDMESLVGAQTQKLEQQEQVSALLFELTADVASGTDKHEVIKTVCRRLAVWCGSARIDGYLVSDDKLECVEAVRIMNNSGKLETDVEVSPSMPLERVPETVSVTDHPGLTLPMESYVPFKQGDSIAGVLHLRCKKLNPVLQHESKRVLQTVSEQLSMFMTKQLAAEHVLGVRMIHERNTLAAEIHDSLAQTLLAVRNQITILRDEAEGSNSNHWSDEIRKLETSVNVANQEVRGLIHEYRSPITERRDTTALSEAIARFRSTTDMDVFFQCTNPAIEFKPREESVVQQIVGESLANAEKYAEADMIRVYLHGDRHGIRTLLVEDDGVGFSLEDDTGTDLDNIEHFGMSIMQERAVSIGAILSIESEPGEGTRISLKLPPLTDS